MDFFEKTKDIPSWVFDSLLVLSSVILTAVSSYIFMGIKKKRDANTDVQVEKIKDVSVIEKNIHLIKYLSKSLKAPNLLEDLNSNLPVAERVELLLTPDNMRQKNIVEAIKKCENLKSIEDLEKIQLDFLSDWSDKAKNSSNEDMRLLWAKLLDAEIGKENSVSRRIMNFVYELSDDEVKLIDSFFNHNVIYSIFSNGSRNIIYLPIEGEEIGIYEIDKLTELGVLARKSFQLNMHGVTKVYYPDKISINVLDISGKIIQCNTTIFAIELFDVIMVNPRQNWMEVNLTGHIRKS